MELKGGNSVTSNTRPGEKAADHGGENSDDGEDQDGEKHKSKYEVGAGSSKENGDSADGEEQSSMIESDPLAESIFKLQSAKEALEKEVEKLREVGDESHETTVEEVHEASSSNMYTIRENMEISPHYLKKHVCTLKQDIDFSESKLKEASSVLKAKETQVTKLELQEIEAEIEDQFKHKLEAEFQYLVISKTVMELKTDVVDQVALSDELETILNVVRDARSNVNMLKGQAENLETRVEDTVATEQVLKLQKRLPEVASCLFIQLVLLVLVVLLFVLHPSSNDAGVVPT